VGRISQQWICGAVIVGTSVVGSLLGIGNPKGFLELGAPGCEWWDDWFFQGRGRKRLFADQILGGCLKKRPMFFAGCGLKEKTTVRGPGNQREKPQIGQGTGFWDACRGVCARVFFFRHQVFVVHRGSIFWGTGFRPRFLIQRRKKFLLKTKCSFLPT